MIPENLGHDEGGALVPITQFDYAAVEGGPADGEVDEIAAMSQEDVDRALKLFTLLVRWLWQNGMQNPGGLKIRAIIVCWIFTKELRALNLTQMAQGFGMDKQSLGRWVEEFKKAFPRIRTPHMRE